MNVINKVQIQRHRSILITLLLLLFSGYNCIGQTKSSVKEDLNSNSFITFDPFLPFEGITSRYRIGYIQNINNRWKVGLSMGYGTRDIVPVANDEAIFESYQLWEIRPELYYFINPRSKHSVYLSFELFYIHHEDQFVDDFYRPKEDAAFVITYDQIDYKRQKYGFNFNHGIMFSIFENFGATLYAGIGIRVRDNEFTNAVNEDTSTDFFLLDINFPDRHRRIGGTEFGVNINLGVNVFWALD